MSVIRALRLANSIEAGTTDATALETLMADTSRKGELSGLLALRGQSRRLADNAIAATALAGSYTANLALQETRAGAEEFASSPVSAPIFAASRTAMRAATSSTAGARRWLTQFPYTTSRDMKVGALLGAAYGNGVYVAVGNGGTFVATSSDAVTWTARTTPIAVLLIDVVFAYNLFIAMSTTGQIVTSPDGITWTQRTQSAVVTVSGGASNKLVVADGRVAFAAQVNATTKPILIFSVDGITWQSSGVPAGGTVGGSGTVGAVFTGVYWVIGSGVQASTNYSVWRLSAGFAAGAVPIGTAFNTNSNVDFISFAYGWMYLTASSGMFTQRWSAELVATSGYSPTFGIFTVLAMAGMTILVTNSSGQWNVSYDNGVTYTAMTGMPSAGNLLRIVNGVMFFSGSANGTNY